MEKSLIETERKAIEIGSNADRIKRIYEKNQKIIGLG